MKYFKKEYLKFTIPTCIVVILLIIRLAYLAGIINPSQVIFRNESEVRAYGKISYSNSKEVKNTYKFNLNPNEELTISARSLEGFYNFDYTQDNKHFTHNKFVDLWKGETYILGTHS